MSAPHPAKRAIVVAVALVAVAGCAVRWSGSGQSDDTDGGGPARGNAASSREANETVNTALKDVERFWESAFPRIANGERFQPVQGGLHPYTRNDPPPRCGSQAVEYQPNAFYCPSGDYIAWDAEQLIPQLYANFGPLLAAVVAAHEYGHAVQARLKQGTQPAIVAEQQADCFAGSWVGDVNAGNSQSFDKVEPKELDDALGGMLMLRDEPGSSALAPQAHGNAFDRVRAFQEGFEQGADRCARYRADNLPVTEVPFSTREEAATGGDLPYDDAVRALTEENQAYWSRVFPQLAGRAWEPLRVVQFNPADPPDCAGRSSTGAAANTAFYCESGNFVAFDGRGLGPRLHERIGDNAVGMLIGGLFAQAVQGRRGESTQGRAGQTAIDCLAGSWTSDLLNRDARDTGVRLSPGDLDEAVAALIAFGRASPSNEVSAFDRIAAYRGGVLQGLSACR
ncbi:MAG TPA: neutral zinc metallopeptidase [Micromonosporaceae bacterium]|nr:neutral zinc metallopeptidase [Micromonosporaceae bacterium]